MMDFHYDDALTQSQLEIDHSYLPNVHKDVYILGCKYDSLDDRGKIAADILSRIWCTYRSGFDGIPGKKMYNSDAGWGCMHRCGQMMLAETFVRMHLGRDWRWLPDADDETYWNILKLFQDRMSSIYSIHSITSLGTKEQKARGDWFGPNTVAHVLKNLCVFDEYTSLQIHVTNEEGIIINDIKELCRKPKKRFLSDGPPPPAAAASSSSQEPLKRSDSTDFADMCLLFDCQSEKPELVDFVPEIVEEFDEEDDDFVAITFAEGEATPGGPGRAAEEQAGRRSAETASPEDADMTRLYKPTEMPADPWDLRDPVKLLQTASSTWRPLLLIVPLRLGVSELNPIYMEALRRALRLPHSVGILGGRPGHAQWLLGVVEESFLCLDPHFTQPAAKFTTSIPSPSEDQTFHCDRPVRVPMSHVDPSLALGFCCPTEADFDELCALLRQQLLHGQKYPILELQESRPRFFGGAMTASSMRRSGTSSASEVDP